MNSGAAKLTNTIIANSLSGDDCAFFGGAFNSLGYNLDSDGTCNLVAVGDKPNNKNACLGPLQDNGGTTETHALLLKSDAVDMGNPDECKDTDGNPLTTDQRGVTASGRSVRHRCI